ncbi:two-component system, chemotaxis family, sensor kinase CheA [Trichlorobacter thiogenes]|uniref:histidine kinase n=1 Tax=Trichlorobacter thiogenes TaxID=115783 RepID=A0A1T4M1I1_9BACT|nr:chemotaxis protein CheA [Trichlorobacter thiogenes]SJZ60813.1 two-component system, chemotaxis family, sensor kinase CheA [Trichlorobacter thiogenes]
MDISRYRDLFVSEAREHLTTLGTLSMRCEEGAADSDSINEMFRHAHSLKGMAATMQLGPITTLSHALEDLLSQIRDGHFSPTRNTVDLMLAAIDTLEQLVALVAQGGELPDSDDLASRIRNHTAAAEEAAATDPTPTASQIKPAAEPAESLFRASDENSTTRVRTALLDRLVTISGELLTVRHTLEDWTNHNQADQLQAPLKELSTLLRQLQNEVFQARMLPFGSIAERYPRMVRDLARKSGKEITFQIYGDTIELDRGVLEQIIEPLVHLLRNAVDHGLETPAERVACGKPPVGSLSLSVSRLADQVLLEVRDDGRGMDPARIRSKAISQGLLNEQQAADLTAQEILLLICSPGFSTAATVTDISGRGVGMDVVQNAIQTIGGTLTIDSTPGHGSIITLRLPISVAIIHALMVACGELQLAVPVSAITSTCEVQRNEIIQKGRDLYLLRDGTEIPLRNLPRFFRQRETLSDNAILPILLAESNKQPIGLLVDRLLGQQEIFTRPLRHPLTDLRGISGSCLLGNGQIVFIVDPTACVGRLCTEN